MRKKKNDSNLILSRVWLVKICCDYFAKWSDLPVWWIVRSGVEPRSNRWLCPRACPCPRVRWEGQSHICRFHWNVKEDLRVKQAICTFALPNALKMIFFWQCFGPILKICIKCALLIKACLHTSCLSPCNLCLCYP